MMGPTQGKTLQKRSKAPKHRSPVSLGLGLFLFIAAILLSVVAVGDVPFMELGKLMYDVLLLKRLPWSSQDLPAVAAATIWSMLLLMLIDVFICFPVFPKKAGARWFLLHGIGNMIVVVLSFPDFYWVVKNPPAAMSVQHCSTLPFPACTDWAPAVIIAVHFYHIIGFSLDANDIFHHALFVPVIGGIRFIYPWGTCANILCFFISGLPGGVDYFLLAAVKGGAMHPMTEKRINCSINTWIRGPGITFFSTIATMCWFYPSPDTKAEDVMPLLVFVPSFFVVNFNGQYYAQRVIGNYYIKKAQAYGKRGEDNVDLHCS
eukprot:g3275.t1